MPQVASQKPVKKKHPMLKIVKTQEKTQNSKRKLKKSVLLGFRVPEKRQKSGLRLLLLLSGSRPNLSSCRPGSETGFAFGLLLAAS